MVRGRCKNAAPKFNASVSCGDQATVINRMRPWNDSSTRRQPADSAPLEALFEVRRSAALPDSIAVQYDGLTKKNGQSGIGHTGTVVFATE